MHVSARDAPNIMHTRQHAKPKVLIMNYLKVDLEIIFTNNTCDQRSRDTCSVCGPEQLDIPHTHTTEEVNKDNITEVMKNKKVMELWNMSNSDFADDERLFFYWPKGLQYTSKKHIRRLS